MALDERQQQIKEGAGLEESRLNVEFIEWLRKWSTPLLVVVALVVLAYVGYQRWELARKAEVDRAFTSLDSITGSQSPSPQSLKSVADEFDGTRAVAHIARLKAADIYLQAARRGIKPGAEPGRDGTPADIADLLTDEQRAAVLTDAEALYSRVLREAGDEEGQELHAIGAAYGLAAVAESRGDPGAADTSYRRVADLARSAGYTLHAEIAAERMASPAAEMPVLYAAADLPKLPWADEEVPPAGDLSIPELTPQEPTPVDPNAPAPESLPPSAAPPVVGSAPDAPGSTPATAPPPPPPQ